MKEWIARHWRTMRRPSRYYRMGFLSLGGFIMGILFWGAFNTAMEFTNTEVFCTSCHQPIYEELQNTIHFTNRSGVRAKCSACHVPHDWTDKVARKMQASKEVFAWIAGTIDTPEKFEARWSAATVTSSTTWISPGRASVRSPSIRRRSPAATRRASTATRALLTSCRT